MTFTSLNVTLSEAKGAMPAFAPFASLRVTWGKG
jgi:hypothetical protein